MNQQPSDPSVYTWSLSKGDDGQQGEPGKSPYNVVLISSNGLLFKNGVLSTAIQAVVFKGDEDVTDLLDANQFKWKKTNGDGTPDELSIMFQLIVKIRRTNQLRDN